MKLINTCREWFQQPQEEKLLDVITTFLVGGSMLGLLGCLFWPNILLPIGIVAGSALAIVVIADEIFVSSIAAKAYRSTRQKDDN